VLQNYVKRLYHLDQEIKWLLGELDKQSDEVIVVMFSDHLPNLPCLTDKSIYSHDLFFVPYFISHHHPSFNCEFPPQLKAYQLGYHLMKSMKVPLSLMQRIHETYAKDESYLDILRLVQYDQIEGRNYLTNEASNNSQSKLQFGLGEQQINSYEWVEAGLLVRGNGFNIDSHLYLDHKKVQTVYLSETELLVPIDFKVFEVITLKQLSRRHEVLGEEVEFVVKEVEMLTRVSESDRVNRSD
ncbi:MAG: hypothetical protein IJ085_07070, partial [Turicibacter sp.]|nr:hypothetical protein [Turicibacter sp.]